MIFNIIRMMMIDHDLQHDNNDDDDDDDRSWSSTW